MTNIVAVSFLSFYSINMIKNAIVRVYATVGWAILSVVNKVISHPLYYTNVSEELGDRIYSHINNTALHLISFKKNNS